MAESSPTNIEQLIAGTLEIIELPAPIIITPPTP